ncbi:hypothetical protein [Bradyrhizobium acaciae]|uniref:hypothetical protein n=1 Tax=Bradyrhizobium acaciae TaxID=2683706 RepID=UPI001E48CB2C|nr:hypothetical protein [Bradyrhizobium acaciae]
MQRSKGCMNRATVRPTYLGAVQPSPRSHVVVIPDHNGYCDPIQRRMSVVGNGNMGVGNESAASKSGQQQQMTAAMPQQGAYVMGDNECAPQKLVRLVGCRDSKVRPGLSLGPKQFGQTNR